MVKRNCNCNSICCGKCPPEGASFATNGHAIVSGTVVSETTITGNLWKYEFNFDMEVNTSFSSSPYYQWSGISPFNNEVKIYKNGTLHNSGVITLTGIGIRCENDAWSIILNCASYGVLPPSGFTAKATNIAMFNCSKNRPIYSNTLTDFNFTTSDDIFDTRTATGNVTVTFS